jgi:TolB-like protein/tetratricopeptide (TPR) repeat protein
LAADIAGYSALMGADEARTVRDLKGHQAVVLPMIGEFGGRIIDTAGDGILAEFPSVVNALKCAVAIQSKMAERNAAIEAERRMQFRIGINVGDVVYDDVRIYGDGINVAARLEGIAEPGGICVSGKVYEEINGRIDLAFQDIGEQQLKNIARKVRAYRVQLKSVPSTAAPQLAVPDKPSIAVLPFQNMSGDPEQDYFADGIVEDIITALSRFRHLFVIARNSSFTYKGRAVDVKQVGRELGVRYVLEGSVRKAANRVRITGQLIDAATGTHLWADRFDGALEDVFDLQDQVTTSVVSAIAPKLEQAEIERAKRKPTESLDAYDYYLRGVENIHLQTRESVGEALRLFSKAIELDADYAAAYGMAAFCYTLRKGSGWVSDRAWETAESARLARRAVELAKDDAVALSRAGQALAYVVEDFDAGALYIDRALALNPNLASGWYSSCWLRVWIGEPETTIKHCAYFMRLSPVDPLLPRVHNASAFAHLFIGRYEEAVSHADRSLRESPNSHQSLRAAATSHALSGRIAQAQKAMVRLRQIDPTLRISNLRDLTPLQRREDMARYAEGMRRAGLPE